MTFATPEALFGLLGIPLLAGAIWLRARRSQGPALLYPSLALTPPPRRRWWRTYSGVILAFLRLAAVALLIVAVARPQTGSAREVIRGDGVDIALALDISGSMAERDLGAGGRIAAAKSAIAEFVSAREHDRIGLVIFAKGAFRQVPPTLDHGVLLSVTERVELARSVGIEDGTAIGMGLATAASMLRDSQADSRLIVLLTDGVNNEGAIDPITAARAAAALDMRVYTIGVGNPEYRPQLGVTSAESELDEETLREIATITGGRYFRATDSLGLKQVYAEIDQLERSELEVITFGSRFERAAWFLAGALALMLLEFASRRTVLRRLP